MNRFICVYFLNRSLLNGASWLRGYTGHEHLDSFGLINMNARLYDPNPDSYREGRMLSVDNYVSAPGTAMGYNRYAYAMNNPVMYTDPSGNFILPFLLYFTETGYDIQKYLLPVAVKINVDLGTHKKGIGIEASFGVPQIGLGARYHVGQSYYWKNYEITPGWEKTEGWEASAGGVLTVGQTHYDSPGEEFDQTIGHARLGIPGVNIKYYNDWFPLLPIGDGGDRYRTAALKAQLGIFSAGFNLFTGDPGLYEKDRVTVNGQYVKGKTDPDRYRVGAAYIGIGPVRIGTDNEGNRHFIQNRTIHSNIGSPYFKVLENRPNKLYFQLWGGSGLW